MDIELLLGNFCEYSRVIKGLAPRTLQRFHYSVLFLKKFLGVTKIEEITPRKVQEFFYYGRSERHWSAQGFLHYHKSINMFFKWCVKNGYMPVNPIDDIEIPRLEKKLPEKLTKQESMRILEYVYNYPWESSFVRCRNYAIFSMFIFAGLRKQELLNLKMMDVDIENLVIFIRQGKGSKDRTIPMSYTLAQNLRKYTNEREKLRKTCPEFFTSAVNNGGFNDIGIRRLLKKMSDETGYRIAAHKLRHTFATLMMEGGCDIYSLSRMMGHTDIKTTCIYLYASVEHLRGQITKHPLNNI